MRGSGQDLLVGRSPREKTTSADEDLPVHAQKIILEAHSYHLGGTYFTNSGSREFSGTMTWGARGEIPSSWIQKAGMQHEDHLYNTATFHHLRQEELTPVEL